MARWKFKFFSLVVGVCTVCLYSGEALSVPLHPCKSGGRVVYQTQALGRCYNLYTQISKVRTTPNLYVPADLTGIQMRYLRPPFAMAGRNFYFADLSQGYLNGMAMDGASFDWADLTGISAWHSSWLGASLRDARMVGAKLFGANFADADLTGAQLMYVDLSFADLRRSDLSSADLTAANTMGAHFEGAKYTTLTKLPFAEEKARRLGMVKSSAGTP